VSKGKGKKKKKKGSAGKTREREKKGQSRAFVGSMMGLCQLGLGLAGNWLEFLPS
jgi:hypothetical protein